MKPTLKERLAAARDSLAKGDLDNAEQLFSALAHENPNQGAYAGLAAVSMRRRDWAAALARWDDVMTKYAAHIQPAWRNARAHALVQLGRQHDAVDEFLRALAADANLAAAQRGLFNALIATGQHERGLHELDHGVFRGLENSTLLYSRSRLCCGRNKYESARAAFRKALDSAEEPAEWIGLFILLARLYDGVEKRALHLEMLSRIQEVSPSDARHAEFESLSLRLLLALGNHDEFIEKINASGNETVRQLPLGDLLWSVAEKLQNPAAAPPKVFVIGLSKTGTTSLAAALTTLGLATADWQDPLTADLLGVDTARFYDALSDAPAAAQFEWFADNYADAKFIYTTRPIGDWERSFTRHIHRVAGWPDFATMKALGPHVREEFGGRAAAIEAHLLLRYDTLPEAYAAHDARVRRYFSGNAAQRLLEFNVFTGDSWPALCGFLGKPVPSSPFPHKNLAPALA